jgi:hypothetical protein
MIEVAFDLFGVSVHDPDTNPAPGRALLANGDAPHAFALEHAWTPGHLRDELLVLAPAGLEQ